MTSTTVTPISFSTHFHHSSAIHSPAYIQFTNYTFLRPKSPAISLRKTCRFLFPVPLNILSTVRSNRYAKSTESTAETSTGDNGDGDSGDDRFQSSDEFENAVTGGSKRNVNVSSLSDALNLNSRDPVYEVVEVSSKGMVSTRKVNRRHLLKSSGLRPRDIRSVDPSLWLTNTMPSLLVRENAILLNLGSLRAIAMQDSVFIFNYQRKGGKAFIDDLLPRLSPKSMIGGALVMPFELEVVEAALNSRIQHFEHRLMDLDPHVELGSKAGALRQMLLDMLEDSQEIRRLCIVGRNCILNRNADLECSVPLDKQVAEEEEEEIEMLLENYLHRWVNSVLQ
ncbi:putative magnesium transporter MRS2 [Helianthus annuus]|nr:putative magnesium transporter MRS2 [Helianthus annuus]